MEAGRTRYEVRVGALLGEATLASFPVALTPVAVPRNTVVRFRLPADREISDVLRRLMERDVEVVEIRRCSGPARPRRSLQVPSAEADPDGGVVLAFPGRRRP